MPIEWDDEPQGNIVWDDEPESNPVRALGSGVAQGATGFAGLPADAVGWAHDFADYLVRKPGEWLGYDFSEADRLDQEGERLDQYLPSPRTVQDVAGGAALKGYVDKATGGYTDFTPETSSDKYLQTGAAFTTGSAMGGARSLKDIIQYGVIPAFTSETAGQLTEGSDYEPYARLIGGVAPQLTGAVFNRMRGAAASADDVAEQMARKREFDRYRIQPDRGQLSGKFGDQATGQAMLHGERGLGAQNVMRNAAEAQRGQVTGARDILRGYTGSAQGGNVVDTSDDLARAMVKRKDQLKNISNMAFRKVDRLGGGVAADGLTSLTTRIVDKLDDAGLLSGRQIQNNAVRSQFEKLQELSQKTGSVGWGAIQNRRSALTTAQRTSSDGTTRYQLGLMTDAFDEWADDIVASGKAIGDGKALGQLKIARSFWKRFKGLEKHPNSTVRRIVNQDLDAEQTATALMGANKLGKSSSAQALRAIKKELGDTPKTQKMLAEMKSAVIDRLFKDVRTQDTKGIQKLASDIRRYTDDEAPELMRELFGDDGIRELRRFAGMLDNMKPSDLAMNPSKSGHKAIRALKELVKPAIGAAVGAVAGGPTGALIGGALGKPALSPIAEAMAKRAATQFASPNVPRVAGALIPAPLVGGAAGGIDRPGPPAPPSPEPMDPRVRQQLMDEMIARGGY